MNTETLEIQNGQKLLQPGWAGEIDKVEAIYIAKELNGSVRLRQLWHTKEVLRYHRRITPAMAIRLARWWATPNNQSTELP